MIDDDLVEAREIVKATLPQDSHRRCNCRDEIDAGSWDGGQKVRATLAGIKLGRSLGFGAEDNGPKDGLTRAGLRRRLEREKRLRVMMEQRHQREKADLHRKGFRTAQTRAADLWRSMANGIDQRTEGDKMAGKRPPEPARRLRRAADAIASLEMEASQ